MFTVESVGDVTVTLPVAKDGIVFKVFIKPLNDLKGMAKLVEATVKIEEELKAKTETSGGTS